MNPTTKKTIVNHGNVPNRLSKNHPTRKPAMGASANVKGIDRASPRR